MKRVNGFLMALCAIGLAFSTATFARDAKKDVDAYPHATRKEPKVSLGSSEQTALNKAADLLNDGKDSEARPYAEKVLASGKASPYAKAFANELLGTIAWNADKSDEAIDGYKKALALDALPNKSQFSLLYRLAQMQLQSEKYEDSLASLEQWEKLTGSQNADELALKANAYYRLDKFQPAIDNMKQAIATAEKPNDSWSQILMASYFELDQYDEAAKIVQGMLQKDPANKKLINQLAQVYIQGDKPEEALQVLAKAKADGLFNTADDYSQLAKLYSMADKPKDGAAIIKEGLANNVLKGDLENYKLLGDLCMQAEDDPCALDAYGKAAPLAKDGNVQYQLGYLQFYAGNSKAAVDSLSQAISKGGLRQEGEAYLLRGDAQNDLGQTAAATADWQKAASFPSAKTMAEQRLQAVKKGAKIHAGKKK